MQNQPKQRQFEQNESKQKRRKRAEACQTNRSSAERKGVKSQWPRSRANGQGSWPRVTAKAKVQGPRAKVRVNGQDQSKKDKKNISLMSRFPESITIRLHTKIQDIESGLGGVDLWAIWEYAGDDLDRFWASVRSLKLIEAPSRPAPIGPMVPSVRLGTPGHLYGISREA